MWGLRPDDGFWAESVELRSWGSLAVWDGLNNVEKRNSRILELAMRNNEQHSTMILEVC